MRIPYSPCMIPARRVGWFYSNLETTRQVATKKLLEFSPLLIIGNDTIFQTKRRVNFE